MSYVANIKHTTKNHFNETAEYYNESNDGKFVKIMYNDILNRILSINPKKILDLGCGNGNVLKMLQEKTNSDLYGLD